MDEQQFLARVTSDLENLAERIEAARDDAEVDLESGILTVIAPGGTYVLNRHLPNREIWLSSPQSGAWHFAFQDGAWRSTRPPAAELVALLEGELGPF